MSLSRDGGKKKGGLGVFKQWRSKRLVEVREEKEGGWLSWKREREF